MQFNIMLFIIQTPIPDNPDFATLRFHAGPPYEVSSNASYIYHTSKNSALLIIWYPLLND